MTKPGIPPVQKMLFYLAVLAATFLTSCFSNKKLIYFSNIPRDSVLNVDVNLPETKINTNDILQISISSPDAETNALLNIQNSVGASAGQAGYLVDETGVIQLPLLGSFKAAGLTKLELTSQITAKINKDSIALNPVVNVRISNYKVTILGEVNSPGVKAIPNELITLPEALGMAGDLTLYAQRDNIMLMREKDGKRIVKHFSLNNAQMFDKELYYLQNKDVLIVQPNNVKATQANPIISQVLPLVISITSFVLILFNQFK